MPYVTLIVLVCVWAFTRIRGDTRFVACFAFALAAIASALPDPGPQHLTEVAPLLLATTAVAAGIARRSSHATTRQRRVLGCLAIATVLWLAFGMITITARVYDPPVRNGEVIVSSVLRHLQGPPIPLRAEQAIQNDVARLHTLTGGIVFIVRLDAATFYLAGNLKDPTPYDFPARSDFGSAGETGIVKRMRSHRIKYACVSAKDSPLRPDQLDFRPLHINHFIRSHFHFVAHLEACDLYQDPTRAR
jgi:hypothetical protein